MIYKAKVPLGRFEKGDIVGGLTEQQTKQLLAQGFIEQIEDKPQTQKKDTK